MDKAAIIRSVVGCKDRHESTQCMSGWFPDDLKALGGRPSIGSAVSKLQGPVDAAVPPFVGLAKKTSHVPWSHSGDPGFLGRGRVRSGSVGFGRVRSGLVGFSRM
jgi:hypothetical protein